MMKAIPDCKNSDGFQFDLVDVTRQVLANYASPLQQKFVKAYKEKDAAAFTKYSKQFIELIEDVDKLLATRKDFLLGPWIASARKWGSTEKEKALYEFNAKDLITLWGDENCPLNEYACRQWSGLLNEFYKPRWEYFFSRSSAPLHAGKEIDKDDFIKAIKNWEWKWVNKRKDYPVITTSNPVGVAKLMYEKYHLIIQAAN